VKSNKKQEKESEKPLLCVEMFSVSLRFPSDFPYTKNYNKKKWVPQSAAISIKPSALPHNRLDQRTLPAALCANRRNARQTDVSLQPGQKFHGAW